MLVKFSPILSVFFIATITSAQQKANDVNAPLHAMKPDYEIPYTVPNYQSVISVVDKIYNYLDTVTPTVFMHKSTKQVIYNVLNPDTNVVFKTGDFRLTSYEWGVTYGAMLALSNATKADKYKNYTKNRLEFLASNAKAFANLYNAMPKQSNPLRQVVAPKALDDAGSICAANIKLLLIDGNKNLRPIIDKYIDFISNKQQRLKDGTLARNRPLLNTLWLDDLFMSVPALAQMGKLTGEIKYYDDAVKQVLQFSERMFNKTKNLYMHGWVESMQEHPQFHWARANGWALMAMTELLDVLPVNHKGREKVLQQLKFQIKGLVPLQSSNGFWHQLLDKNDSYVETSATAIYTFCIAKAINNGWIDAKAHAPMVLLAWNAVASKVNDKGQVEGTCVGTGMAFDPAFYYYRPINVYAAHGYGPVLLAGSEIINLLKKYSFEMNDSALQLKEKGSEKENF